MGVVQFRILGPLEVLVADEAVDVPAPKERLLLIRLLLDRGEAVATDALIEAVWPEKPPGSAPKLVQQYVSNLRRRLGTPAIETVAPGYRIGVAVSALDAQRFEELWREGRSARGENPELAAALCGRALALWRGDPLPEARFEAFATAEIARLEELRHQCLEDRLSAQLELGQAADCLAELAALAADHPERERLRGLYMLALYQTGRQAEALEVFADTRRELLDRLGLSPGQDLRALERAILRQDDSLEPALHPADRLPPPPAALTPLVGREPELAALRELVLRPDVRLVTIAGAGGSGKTRLALALAAGCQDDFANGVAFVELAAIREPSLVVPTIARALRLADARDAQSAEAVSQALASREALLIVDNVEQVVEAAPRLSELLQGAPRLTIVTTSRRVLHVSGEHVFPLDPLREEDAVRLFVARAEGFGVSPEDPDVAAICRRVDQLPLAIELAASRVRTLSVAQLLGRLADRLPLLTGGARDLPDRQRTLRETIDWSVTLLQDSERSLLARLAVFSGGCSLEAATEVAGADLDSLGALVDHSLLRRAGGERPRFGTLETVREYALELLGPERPAAERAHTAHFLGLAERADLHGEGQRAWLEALELEHDNLRVALERASTEGDDTELRLAAALWRFWWLHGHLTEGRARLDGALARAPGDARSRAEAYRGLAGLAWSQGAGEEADGLAERGLGAARELGDGQAEIGCLTILGLLARDRGDFDSARDWLEQSAAAARRLGRESDVVVAELNLGTVAYNSGDLETAARRWEPVLAYHQARRSDEGAALTLLNLGLVDYRLGRMNRARSRFGEARALFGAIGFREHLGHALQGLAAVAADSGDGEEAARLLAEARGHLDGTGAATFNPELALEAEATARALLGDERFEAVSAASLSS